MKFPKYHGLLSLNAPYAIGYLASSVPAINWQTDTSNPACVITGKNNGKFCDIVRLPRSVERMFPT